MNETLSPTIALPRRGLASTLAALLMMAVVASTAPAQSCTTDADCDDGNSCTLDTCASLVCQHDSAARDGFVCDDGEACTLTDVCIGGICNGTIGGDTDGDGYCDFFEEQQGCSPTDGAEIPPQAAAFPGGGGGAPGNVLMTFASPTNRKIVISSDPSCAQVGQCGALGFCTWGRIADPCEADADCNQPANTCRVVVNWANFPDIAFDPKGGVHVNKVDVTASFTPVTFGCTRKVDISVDAVRTTRLRLKKLQATASGRRRRDTDMFRYVK